MVGRVYELSIIEWEFCEKQVKENSLKFENDDLQENTRRLMVVSESEELLREWIERDARNDLYFTNGKWEKESKGEVYLAEDSQKRLISYSYTLLGTALILPDHPS